MTGSDTIHIGNYGDGVLTVANGATVEFLYAVAALGSNASGTINIGAVAGDSAVAAGAFNVDELHFGSGTGELVFNHTNSGYVFGTDIYGAGALRVLDGSTTLSGNNSGFSGTTTVEAGTLIVNGSLGGTLDVANARLGGSGTVGTTVLGAGAVIAPGSSVGTLTVAGDLTFDADSTYEVEVGTSSNTVDLIYVTGTAYLNGASVAHVGLAGSYPWYLTRTILTADGGLDGTFGGIASDFAFLTPDLSYDANNVRMTLLRNDIDFAEVTTTPNQQGVASATNGLGPGNPIYDEILTMTEEEARAAFDALSGEAYGSAGSAAFNSAQQLRDVLQVRLQMFSGARVVSSAGYAPAAGDALAADAPAVWGQLFGSWGTNDATATAAKLDRRSSGFLGGADKAVGENSRVGFALGYSRST
ncbi:MAG: autotransporter outer membrane beta-barrel domain-containing protein, partial [Parvibaculum sp.]|nr:autotransporter outer membrane beta-barrel domain-containing protein [Parvibaculum sp.]